ncbi:MAG: hypothetical protein ACXVB9_11840 [Bdellovibrionota bacterium]
MKNLILILATSLLPLTAGAATHLKCASTPVDFTIDSEGSILTPGVKLTVVASGIQETQLEAQVDVVERGLAPLAVVNITTLDATGKDNPNSSIHARLEIPLADVEVNPAATGAIQITKIPPIHPRRMLTRYNLSNCTGTL